ncbi:TPA: ORF6N domain-containing protein [Providencia stuartii]|uniref:ORF6N domain-containing protein n=1 Tax=Providencia stuartii TaxID=588 RepID=UPI0006893AAA|nr:ORF6N domain-containing protein [Providencia stuartii]AXO20092.1 ORF6N domain-containing protein [Providencia stuartii]MBN5592935.1 ORF6N domain-containing protein [Providencia stuartii]QET99027.1 ORF6N domain-containing protein [Providencia stuartii]HEM6907548.1 ORF6N domain-containing protein [Providencia stuartii]HEM7154148.1 ORF6N domain-containing protein [Providencia stuartii]
MTTQISVESLSVITFKDIPVVTSELLAALYGADSKLVRQNYQRNADRFIEGKHFYKLTGSTLKEFKMQTSKRGLDNISPKVSQLLLWTERGAARHAKMLETDQAWDVFEKLEDYYFNSKSDTPKESALIEHKAAPIMVTIPTDGRWLVVYKNGKHQVINVDGHNVVNVEYIQKLQRDSNLLIELLKSYRQRTQVLQGDKSGDILNVPLVTK